MKVKNYFMLALTGVICGCAQFKYDEFNITEKPFVDRTNVRLYIGAEAGNRNQAQLTSSPEGRQYTWSSLDPTVATVTQSGLITAIGEGFALITVASSNDVTNVNVWVQNWIPLLDFTLSHQNITVNKKDRMQIIATLVPTDASEPDIQWSSSDANIVTALENGWIICNNSGRAVISASAQGIVRQVNVTIP